MDTITEYYGTVIDEGGYKVKLSNQGLKRKRNPCPFNPGKQKIYCKHPNCKKKTRAFDGLCPKHKGLRHSVDWIGLLKLATLKSQRPIFDNSPVLTAFAPAHYETTELLIRWMKQDQSREIIMDAFIQKSLVAIVGNIPDATTLQINLENRLGFQPDSLISILMRVIDDSFPFASYENEKIPNVLLEIHKDCKIVVNIPLRVVAALLVTGFACEESNRGDYWWYKTHPLLEPADSEMASAYMSVIYYLLRRHTNATEQQAWKALP